MNKRISRLTNLVATTKDFNSFIKCINLDLNSCFLCLLNVLESSILEYDSIVDYYYLDKLSDYLKKNYEELSKKNRQNNKSYMIKLKNILKKDIGLISEYDKEYFRKIYYTLEMLILLKNNKNNKEYISNIDLSDLLYEVIFRFNSLEYLDLLLEKDKDIVNSTRNGQSIFSIVFHEYINGIVNNSTETSFYIRVLYKFLHSENFNFDNKIKEDVINSLDTFINFKKISKERFEEIKDLYAFVKNQYIMSNYKINDTEYELKEVDFGYLEKFKEKEKFRKKIDDYIITIDDSESKVLDDAMSITKLKNGNLLFKIHIADPLAIFSYKSDIMQDARLRTSSIYLPNDVIHMLPKSISEDKFSLIEGHDRYTKTFCFEYNQDEGIVDFNIINSVINVSKRYSYNEINSIYKNGGTCKELEMMLLYYDEILSYLKKLFKNAKVYEEFKTGIVGSKQKSSSFSENLICYSMIVTGYMTAKYFSEHDLPYMYRCHQFDENWQNYIEEYMKLREETKYKKMLKDLKDRFPKSYYSRDNSGHMGLKLKYYSHITSPLRRFSDDVNMHAIDLCYFNNPTDRQIYKLEREIDTTSDYINMQSNTIDEYIGKKLIK